jgi:prepilin-type N-terminal cleavage/methylation domain-containing protein
MRSNFRNHGFTLLELLLVIGIIGVLASMSLLVLADAANSAKISRAKVQIRKINGLIMERWESFETRTVPFKLNPALNPSIRDARNAARIRLYALRELMRLELPDRYTDILPLNADPPAVNGTLQIPVPLDDGSAVQFQIGANSLNRFYRSQIQANFTPEFQGAECLYLILLSIQDEYGNGLEAFSDSEIGDVDEDGMKEILDPWGTPIDFLRWAPGYSETSEDLAASWTPPPTIPSAAVRSPVQSGDPVNDPDPTDPLRADLRYQDTSVLTDDPYRLVPLIYSAGPDRSYDVWRRDEIDHGFHDFGSGESQLVNYTDPNLYEYPNDPYWGVGLVNDTTPSVGFRVDWDGDWIEGYYDNIDNHFGLED